MINVQLIRSLDNGVETVGKLYITGDATFACDTLERTYADNKRGISCIPGGTYICRKRADTEAIAYEHILVEGVTGRDGICIHAGNLYTHSKGCILVGKGYSDINKDGQQDVLNSKNTFAALMKIIPQEFKLKITETNIKTRSA